MSKAALSVFLVIALLLSVFGVAEAAANFRTASNGSSMPSSPIAASTGYDSRGNGYVYQAAKIPTALIVNVPKTTVHVGETLTVNAKLINVNNGYGIPGAIVRGYFSQDGINWFEPGTLTTDNKGEYSYTGTVPDYPGTYYGYVSYDGSDTYQGCEGSHYTVTVLPQPTSIPTPTPLPTPTPNPTSTASSPVPSPASTASGSSPISTSTVTATASTNTTLSIKPTLSGSSPGFGAVCGFTALTLAVVLMFRKKLGR
jgi:hypothetical protein